MASELASVDKLRNFYMKGCKCNDPYTVIKCGVPRKVREIADEIDREVSERFMELPVDANDAEVIQIGEKADAEDVKDVFNILDATDARKKLEADVRATASAIYENGRIDGDLRDTEPVRVGFEWIIGLLDRQAAITKRELRREIAERFIELPVDADGVPIHLGDRLDNFGEKFVCEWIEFEMGNASVGYAIGDGELPPAFAPDECEHVKQRTIEDVLTDYAANGLTLEEAAAELRGMMEADE